MVKITKYEEWLNHIETKEGLQREFDRKIKSYQYQLGNETMYKAILSGESKIVASNPKENALKHEKNRKKIEKQLMQIKEVACKKFKLC